MRTIDFLVQLHSVSGAGVAAVLKGAASGEKEVILSEEWPLPSRARISLAPLERAELQASVCESLLSGPGARNTSLFAPQASHLDFMHSANMTMDRRGPTPPTSSSVFSGAELP